MSTPHQADTARMHADLAGCEACKVYLDQLRATIRIVGEAGPATTLSLDPQRVDALVDLFRSERHD